MVFKGHFSKGVIVPDEPMILPEGATVSILAEEHTQASAESAPKATILDLFSGLVGQAKNLPPDAAENVDHYLYGLPKVE